MQTDWVKYLISIAKEMAVSNLPALLPILRSVMGEVLTALTGLLRNQGSLRVQAPKEPTVTSTPVTVEQQLQLMVDEWYRR